MQKERKEKEENGVCVWGWLAKLESMISFFIKK